MFFDDVAGHQSGTVSGINFIDHIRRTMGGGTTSTSGTFDVPTNAKSAIVCLVSVDGTAGSCTGDADEVRIDDGTGSLFSLASSSFNGNADHDASIWYLNDVDTGTRALYVDHKDSDDPAITQFAILFFDKNLSFEASSFSGYTLHTTATDVTVSHTLSSLTTDDKLFIGFGKTDFGQGAGDPPAEDTTTDYTDVLLGFAGDPSPVDDYWEIGTGGTGQGDETSGWPMFWFSDGGVSSETLGITWPVSLAKSRRHVVGLAAFTAV